VSRPRDEEGVVLILVLVLLVVTISTVYAINKTAMLEILGSRYRVDRVRADLLARSGPDIAMRALQDDLANVDSLTGAVESGQDGWALLGEQPIQVAGGSLHIRVSDIGSGININGLIDPVEGASGQESRSFLIATLRQIADTTPTVLEEATYTDEKINDLADAILDWLDKNEETRLGSSEEEYYLGIEKAESAPLNRPIFSLDELAPIPGLGALMLEAMKAYFTTYPMFPAAGSGGINLNTAPPHALGLLYHGTGLDYQLIKPRDILDIMRARSEGSIFCSGATDDERCVRLGDVLGVVGTGEVFFPPIQYTSQVFRVDVEARVGESDAQARSCVSAIIDRAAPPESRTLYYRLGC